MGNVNLPGEQINLQGGQIPIQLTCYLPPWMTVLSKIFNFEFTVLQPPYPVWSICFHKNLVINAYKQNKIATVLKYQALLITTHNGQR